jgi:hypothetical protein
VHRDAEQDRAQNFEGKRGDSIGETVAAVYDCRNRYLADVASATVAMERRGQTMQKRREATGGGDRATGFAESEVTPVAV